VKLGQFCPIAKASEVLGERWMLLLVRELVSGATRYRDLQRGLGRISPSVLSSRLKTLIDRGLLERVDSDVAPGGEYRLTQAGAELAPILAGIAVWGQRWVRSGMSRDELDVEFLMLSVRRNFDVKAFPKDHGVVVFVFSDLVGARRRWWLLLERGEAELCAQPPGRPEDVVLTCRVRTLAQAFTGQTTIAAALQDRRLEAQGSPKLIRDVHRWLRASPLAVVLRATAT
jgi:DNA-binding HxlR family transcriptional regulator